MEFTLFGYTIQIGFDDNFHGRLIMPRLYKYPKRANPEFAGKYTLAACPDGCKWYWSDLRYPRIIIEKDN